MSNTQKYANEKITARQVDLLIARGASVGRRGRSLLEFIEFECDMPVVALEDILACNLDTILRKLAEED
jgi:hypothetical protein